MKEVGRENACCRMDNEIRRRILDKFKQTERKNGQKFNDRTGGISKTIMIQPMQSELAASTENAGQKTDGEIPYPIP